MALNEWLKKSIQRHLGDKRSENTQADTTLLSQQKASIDDGEYKNTRGFRQDSFYSLYSVSEKESLELKDTWRKQLIKLSIITEFFPPDYAATGQLIEELVRNLAKLGVNIEVFTGQPGYAFGTGDAPAREEFGSTKIKRSRSARLWPGRVRGKAINGVLFTLRAFLHLLRGFRSHDVVLLTSAPPFLPIVGYLGHLIWGVSYVCLIYDIYPDIASGWLL